MKEFQNRLALPRVLDEVHRRTVMETLGSLDVELPDDSWESIQVACDGVAETHDFIPQIVEYSGDHRFGPVYPNRLGDQAFLIESKPLESHMESSDYRMGGDLYNRRIIMGLAERNSRATLYLISDAPPYIIHEDDARYAELLEPELITLPNEGALLTTVQAAFGKEAVEFISEDVAAGIMHALQSDDTKNARQPI
ncbi:MAG TPA: hypothetical protein VJP80_02960 [Candidatus Saccharimonadales bacterium]|nr:hypothetical protein [Candidatus Saccharimonadales bacterium]